MGSAEDRDGPAPIVLDCRGTAIGSVRLPEEATMVQLGPDRALVVSGWREACSAHTLVRRIEEDGPSLYVTDVSAGWCVLRVGDAARDRLAALTVMWPDLDPALPRAGSIAGVPGVVVPTMDGDLVLVGASHGHHLEALLGSSASSRADTEAGLPRREATRA